MSLLRTPLYPVHLAAGARLVDFGGWEMPLHYGSQLDEHRTVRLDSGMFDVSHMRVVDLSGPQALGFLRRLLANDCARLVPGKALYSCMLRPDGGVIDDLIVYRLDGLPGLDADLPPYRLVINAGTADSDLVWMRQVMVDENFRVTIADRPDLAIIAIQGPQARARLVQASPALRDLIGSLGVFSAGLHKDWFVARTGYTGEDGCEIALPAADATALWAALVDAGVRPCGLGARDTLRLEAGMNLYGNDMTAQVTPLESGLAWTVDLREPRDFVGRSALEHQQADGHHARLHGLRLLDPGVLRAHQTVQTAHGAGETTSGTFSPTLGYSIAFARLPAGVKVGDEVRVDLRGRAAKALVCGLSFVRHGKAVGAAHA
jgi:aminomethyltransferase